MDKYDYLFHRLPEEVTTRYRSLKAAYQADIERITALIEQMATHKDMQETIEKYQLLNHFIETEIGNQKAAAYYLAKTQTLNGGANPLSIKDLYPLESQTRKAINELRTLIADREALKVSLSLTEAGSSLSVISSFFLVSGYLYNHFLLGQFGIEVEKYFGLTDYLASSLEGIRYSASGAGLGLLSYFVGKHRTSTKSKRQIEYEASRKEYWPHIMFVSAVSGAVIGYIYNLETFYDCTYFLMVIASMYFGPYVAQKYFKEPMIALFLLIFVASFSAHMFAAVGKTTFKFKNYEFSKLHPFNVKFSEDISHKDNELLVLAGNSEYFFFLDRNRNVMTVRKDNVLYLSQNQPLQ
jgi:hypothetical protein